ncbi:MAG TPA: fibronectin type III domain-containing protein [Verrucomicrobiae bacterium]|nr:fibronectin type III domain-containing protein [Verrucomicrobiae bacterium]
MSTRQNFSVAALLLLILFQMGLSPLRGSAANVMNYGADGNDYFQFSNPSMALDKASGFTTLITFAMHVNADGTLLIGGIACSNGVYLGPSNWNSLITTLKTPPTTVTRYEVCIGGWMDTSYDNIKALVLAQGTGPGSMLYKNFQALKSAVPGIDAINDDDEQTYDVSSSTSFANMLGGLGYKFTLAPYTAQSFWVSLRNNLTNCDAIYLQCYEGGAGNDPGQWNAAFGHGVVVIPGQESNTASEANFHGWYLETGVQGGFYYPDVVFNATYWAASVYEACGIVPTAPAGLAAAPGGKQVILSWNTSPAAASYKVKRSTTSGGEIVIATNAATAFNSFTDTGLSSGVNYYYKVSAFNTNGESLNSSEVGVTPQAGIINNTSFEFDATSPGTTVPSTPAGWTAFNPGGAGGIGSQNAGGVDFTVSNPLAAPAASNQYCYINMFNSGVVGGIYQDVGTLQPNTIYSLTVAIGSRADRNNSPGIISLINGINNNGTVLANGGGLPATQNTWQDYTVTFTTGASVGGDLTIELSTIGSGTIQADFDNVRLTSTPVPVTPPAAPVAVGNFSFEANVVGNGADMSTVPSGWTGFNKTAVDDRGTGHPNATQYTANNPLGSPALGSQYGWVNVFSATPVGGLYQDVGPLQSNTVYTLTVAIGSRKDRVNSAGIISLINGTSNLGKLLASGGGLPAAQNSWQDYSVTYITGASVSGDLTLSLSVIGNDTTIQADFDNVRLTKASLFFTAPVLGAAKISGGNLILTGTNGSPGAGYTWLVTTNLAAPINWLTNSTGTLDANGAFSNSLPVNLSGQVNFFRLRVP